MGYIYCFRFFQIFNKIYKYDTDNGNITNMKNEESIPVKISPRIIQLIDKVKREDEMNFKSRQDVIQYLIRQYIKDQTKTE